MIWLIRKIIFCFSRALIDSENKEYIGYFLPTPETRAKRTREEQDEDESEASFSDEQNGLLERLGVKIDTSLHKIFTSYEIVCLLNF